MKTKPDLGFWKLWNLSFGFFGVQIAYALQSSQVSRIFSTIGADPHDLSYFWILPPLMGLIIQPIVGVASDRTWTSLGRRLPYLLIGALVACAVMCLLPNAGSFGFTISFAIIFGLIMLMFLDTSLNMAMQPFKMLVGDMVNEKQKGLAYSLQSFLCNAGSVVGYVTPFILAWIFTSTAAQGEVPASVTWAFYIGAAILILCVIYTFVKVKEWPPALYNQYNGVDTAQEAKAPKTGLITLIRKAPKVFWTVGAVQFFCWAAFLYMWTYSTDAIAGHAFHAPSMQQATGVTVKGEAFNDNYIFHDQKPIIEKGLLSVGGLVVDGQFTEPRTVVLEGDTILRDGRLVFNDGVAMAELDKPLGAAGQTLRVDDQPVIIGDKAALVSAFSQLKDGDRLTMAHIAAVDGNGKYVLEETSELPATDASITVNYRTVLNAASKPYQEAGNWNGLLLALQGIIAVVWALMIPRFRNRRMAYCVSLFVGAVGFLSTYWLANPWLLFISYGLMGVAWAAMLALPFTILTNALSGGHVGTYLGLFNCSICIPQIVAALLGGAFLSIFPLAANGSAQTIFMLVVAGVLLLIGAACVWNIKETYGLQGKPQADGIDAYPTADQEELA